MSGDRQPYGLAAHPLMPAAVSMLVATLAVAVFAVLELWLVAVGVGMGMALRVAMAVHDLAVRLPRRLARTALEEPWRGMRGYGYEELVTRSLVTLARPWPGSLARAGAHVRSAAADPGDRSVALDRLRSAALMLRQASGEGIKDRWRRWVARLVPTGWAFGTGGGTLLMLGEQTPGPVLGYPGRALTAVAAAAITSTVLSSRRPGGR